MPSMKPDALSKAADLASDVLKPTGGNGALVPRDGNRQDSSSDLHDHLILPFWTCSFGVTGRTRVVVNIFTMHS